MIRGDVIFLTALLCLLQLEKEKAEESLAREKIAQEKDSLLKEKLATVTELEEKSLKLQDVMHEVNTLKRLEHVCWKIKWIKKYTIYTIFSFVQAE